MSIQFTATYEGESFQVEISRDGKLTIPDLDIAYEEMMAVMTGEPTPTLKLLDAWRENTIDVICGYLGLSYKHVARLACDWAENVLHFFEVQYKEDKRPRNAIVAARKYINDEITHQELGKVSEAAENAEKMAEQVWAQKSWAEGLAIGDNAAWSAHKAAEAALVAVVLATWSGAVVWSAATEEVGKAARNLAKVACEAAIWDMERSWQIRHFVHAMECVQAGRDWPDIRETP